MTLLKEKSKQQKHALFCQDFKELKKEPERKNVHKCLSVEPNSAKHTLSLPEPCLVIKAQSVQRLEQPKLSPAPPASI